MESVRVLNPSKCKKSRRELVIEVLLINGLSGSPEGTYLVWECKTSRWISRLGPGVMIEGPINQY